MIFTNESYDGYTLEKSFKLYLLVFRHLGFDLIQSELQARHLKNLDSLNQIGFQITLLHKEESYQFGSVLSGWMNSELENTCNTRLPP